MPLRRKILLLAGLNVAGAVAIGAAFNAWLPTVLIAAASLLCWLPLLLRLTKDIERLDAVSARLAQGQLAAQAPESGGDELASLGRNINQTTAFFDRLVKNQKRFLGDAAHELNAPIARIQFALGLLEQTADARTLHDEIQDMSLLVTELLAYSRASLDAGAAPLTDVSLLQAVQRAADRENVRVEINVPASAVVIAHETYLTRAIGNLIRNAQRYAGDAGPIEITAQKSGGHVELIVGDHGPGLPESELQQIFEPFYRLDAVRTPTTGGNKGLGLAIVKSCVEACHGRVFCRNRQPHGLEVVIHLTPGARWRTGARV